MSCSNCHVCGVHVSKTPLYRQNPKGEKGVFACEEHSKEEPDTFVKEIVETIDKENKSA